MSKAAVNRLMIAAAILAVIYGLLLFQQNRQTAPGLPVPINTTNLRETADKFTISTSKSETNIEKREKKWFIGKKRVPTAKMKNFLTEIEDIDFIRVVSTEADELKEYGLDPKQVKKLTAYRGKSKINTISFGNSAGADTYYVMIGAGDSVYEAEGGLITEVGRSVDDWTRPKDAKKKETTPTPDAPQPIQPPEN